MSGQAYISEPRRGRSAGAKRAGWWPFAAGVPGAVALLLVGLVLGGSSGSAVEHEEFARAAAEDFLNQYVEPDGRVVRWDEGGDTVSEGQVYAMLLAAAIGDRETFDLVWEWTRDNLQRPDGLLSWLWEDGAVADPQPAADADLDATWALLVAADRFDHRRYRKHALEIGKAVLAKETVGVGGRPVLLAGPWAGAERPYAINPSYLSPSGLDALAASPGKKRYATVLRAGYGITARLVGDPTPLPPDWAAVSARGPFATAAPGNEGSTPTYGFDAARLPVRLADSCDRRGRRLAAAIWPFLDEQLDAGGIARVYERRGDPVDTGSHPVGLVGAAAAADAAGEPGARDSLLDQAESLDAESPTYYGAAWVALGRIMLTTDLLGHCGDD